MLDEITTYLIKKNEFRNKAELLTQHPPLPAKRDRIIHYTFICVKSHIECTPLRICKCASEKGLSKNGLLRQDGKEYIVRHGNILNIRFNICNYGIETSYKE